MFSCEFREMFKDTFFTEQLRETPSVSGNDRISAMKLRNSLQMNTMREYLQIRLLLWLFRLERIEESY